MRSRSAALSPQQTVTGVFDENSAMRAAVLILLLLASAAHAEPVVIPPEFRGDWCKSTWETIHRRCREHDERDELKWQFTIDRDTVTFEEETCRPLAFRKGSGKLKGEYIVRLACQGDQPEGK